MNRFNKSQKIMVKRNILTTNIKISDILIF